MKKLLFVALGLSCGMIWGCKKKQNSSPDVIQPRGIHAKVNGVAWEGSNLGISSLTAAGRYYVQFEGEDSASRQKLSITLNDFTGKGTQTITATSDNKAFYMQDTTAGYEQGIEVNATSGTVVITMLNDTAVGGTFSFTAGGNTITEGTFNVNY